MKLRDALEEAYDESAYHLFNEGTTSEAVKILVESLEAYDFVIVPKYATADMIARGGYDSEYIYAAMLPARPKLDDA